MLKLNKELQVSEIFSDKNIELYVENNLDMIHKNNFWGFYVSIDGEITRNSILNKTIYMVFLPIGISEPINSSYLLTVNGKEKASKELIDIIRKYGIKNHEKYLNMIFDGRNTRYVTFEQFGKEFFLKFSDSLYDSENVFDIKLSEFDINILKSIYMDFECFFSSFNTIYNKSRSELIKQLTVDDIIEIIDYHYEETADIKKFRTFRNNFTKNGSSNGISLIKFYLELLDIKWIQNDRNLSIKIIAMILNIYDKDFYKNYNLDDDISAAIIKLDLNPINVTIDGNISKFKFITDLNYHNFLYKFKNKDTDLFMFGDEHKVMADHISAYLQNRDFIDNNIDYIDKQITDEMISNFNKVYFLNSLLKNKDSKIFFV